MTTTLPTPPKKAFYKRWWFWLIIIIVLVAGIGGLIGYATYTSMCEQAVASVKQTTTVEQRDLKRTISTNGAIVPDEKLQLQFTIPGKVTKLNYQVGDLVDKNAIMAEIDGGSFARRSDEELKAPFDGKVLAVYTFVDDMITPTQPVFEFGFRGSHIEFTASEAEVIDLQVGQTASISVPAYNNGKENFSGTVTFVDINKQTSQAASSLTAATESGYVVKVSADQLPETIRQTNGLSVDVVIDVASKANALSIEPAAIQYDPDDKPFVYLAPTLDEAFYQAASQTTDITSLLTKQSITTGFIGDDYTEVTSGLKAGDTVLLFIPKALRPSGF